MNIEPSLKTLAFFDEIQFKKLITENIKDELNNEKQEIIGTISFKYNHLIFNIFL